jgi:group II intron reverse transcriptase/maturase
MASSREEQRQQNIPQGSYPQEETVNPWGIEEVPSSSAARTTEPAREVRYDHLMEQVVERSNLLQALHRVERNKGAAGVDGMATKSLRSYLLNNWTRIREELLNGTYQPLPVRRVEIPKPDGGIRLLGIPTVLDRLIQQALLQVLTPIFDPQFSPMSFGFRQGRSAHQAVKTAQLFIRQGFRHVVDMDLEKFFDRVNHDILMSKLEKRISDKRVLKLVRRYLQAGVMINGCCVVSEEGTPQGGPLSPLLANIMLDDLDRELTRRGHRFVRYADDCNIYVQTRRAGERVLQSVKQFVEKRLKLKVNAEKSAVDRPWKRKFLGFSFTVQKDSRLRLAPKTIKRFKEKVREITSRSKSRSLESRIQALNTYLNGWSGYFRIADTKSVFQSLDEWTRRRLRMCLLKQWKKPKTKRKNLVSLGIPREWAILISCSRKGHWRLANSPQVNKALGLTYWQAQGLTSLVVRFNELRSTT